MVHARIACGTTFVLWNDRSVGELVWAAAVDGLKCMHALHMRQGLARICARVLLEKMALALQVKPLLESCACMTRM
jgi:hypothetical protein